MTMLGNYINLDKSIARRMQMEEAIKNSKLKFPLQRFAAINGKDYEFPNKKLSFGQWGCWLSHLSIIEHYSNINNNEPVLILEDDCEFNEYLNIAIDLINNYKEDWDILYLDATFVEVDDMFSINGILSTMNTSEPKIYDIDSRTTIYGTHGYILNPLKIKKILELLKANIFIGLPIDNVFCALINQGRLSAKIILPLLIYPSDQNEKSEISTEQHPLINDWITYRYLISLKNIKQMGALKAIEESKKIGQRRVLFDFSKKFQPLGSISLT